MRGKELIHPSALPHGPTRREGLKTAVLIDLFARDYLATFITQLPASTCTVSTRPKPRA